MKYLLAIFFCLTLYAPDVAKLVAYADYTIDIATSKKVNICDCEPLLNPATDAEDHSDHEVTFKFDFQYVAPQLISINPQYFVTDKTYPNVTDSHLPQFPSAIFQPPKV